MHVPAVVSVVMSRRYVSAPDVTRYVTAHVSVRKVTGRVTRPPARKQDTVSRSCLLMLPLATNKYTIGHFSRPVNQVCYLIRAKQVSYLVLGFYRPVDRVESHLWTNHTLRSI